MKIIKQEKSKLLPRTDVVAVEVHVGRRTPSVQEVQDELSKVLKVEKDLILVDSIYSNFGSGESKINAYVYDNKNELNNIVKKTKKQKEAEAKAIAEAKKAALDAKKAEEEAKNATPAENESVE